MEFQQASPAYRILVIGANGGIGKQCIEVALQAGHHVTAVLRNPANLTLTHPRLQIVRGDILNPDTFSEHLTNKDAVISAIGVSGGFGRDKPTTLYSQGSENVLLEMKKRGVTRVFFISASAIEISPVLPFFVRLVARYVVQKLLRNMYADLRRMEQIVKEGSANWTIIRPPRLVDQPVTGHYRFAINAFLRNCLTVSRANVAHFIIHHIPNQATYQATVEIAH